MELDVTLMLKSTYDTGGESDERHKSAGRAGFVRAHLFSYAGRTDLKNYDRLWATITRLRTNV